MNWHVAYLNRCLSAVGHRRAGCVGVLLGVVASCAEAAVPAVQTGRAAAPDEGAALGLIVKLRESGGVPSVVRLAATARPADSERVQLGRLHAAAHRRSTGFLAHKATAFGAHVVHPGRVMSLREAEQEAARWRADPDVEWVVVNERLKPMAPPTGGHLPSAVTTTPMWFEQQWWLQDTAALAEREGVPNIRPAWERLAGSGRQLYPVAVAVLDSGWRDLPGMSGRWIPGYDFVSEAAYAKDGDGLDADATDPGDGLTEAEIAANPGTYPSPFCGAHASSWHGPAIAGMLGGQGDSSLGVMGMLPQLGRGGQGGPLIMPVRISGSCGAFVSDVIEGLLWSAGVRYHGEPSVNLSPARVLSLSFGGSGTCRNPDSEADRLYQQAVVALRAKGALVVASAGNGDGSTGAGGAARPANCEGVLAVTGLTRRGLKASYANKIESGLATVSGEAGSQSAGLLMPGYAEAGPAAVVAHGTSFASPIVAGVAAMMLSLDPSLTVDELRTLLTRTAAFDGVLRPHIASTDLVSPPLPVPPACQADGVPQGNCFCTTETCGAGILDADLAVATVLSRLDARGGPQAFDEPSVTAAWFTPDRLQPGTPGGPSRSGGGGGGALSWPWLLCWAALLALAPRRRRVNGKR